MPSLAQHATSSLVKTVVVGPSGTRKTTGLASLAKAGYNLYILDADNGLGALVRELADDKAALARVQYEQVFDKMKNVGGQIMVDGAPKAWPRAMEVLTNWPNKGPLEKWTDKDVLVIDTLTTLGAAALTYICILNNHEGKPSQPDWGSAMGQVERMIQMLAGPAANCHVVLNTHVNYTESAEGSGVMEGFPSALGNKLSPRIPIYFDNVLVTKRIGLGANAKFVYMLRGDGLVNGKSSYRGKTELPIETGLAEFFFQVSGRKPTG